MLTLRRRPRHVAVTIEACAIEELLDTPTPPGVYVRREAEASHCPLVTLLGPREAVRATLLDRWGLDPEDADRTIEWWSRHPYHAKEDHDG